MWLLLAVEGLLWLSERFHWFAFNQHKGYAVLIAVAGVAVFLLLMRLWFLAGLEHLKGLSQLQQLDLSNTKISDAGLEDLKGLTKLLYLSLDHTNVTDAGVTKLRQALPKCDFGP